MVELRQYLDRGEVAYLKVDRIESVAGRLVFPRFMVYFEGGHSDLSFSGFRYVSTYLEMVEDRG